MNKIVQRLLFCVGLLYVSPTLGGMTAKTVDIEVSGGVKLSARYFPAKLKAATKGPAVLLLSMCDPTADQTEWSTVAAQLQSVGISAMTVDYRGYGTSEGKKPMNLRTVDVAMPYWRKHWLADVETVYQYLLAQKGVDTTRIGIGGASCGSFMSIEMLLKYADFKTFVSLGGPVDKQQLSQLPKKDDIPMMIIAPNEGPTQQWVTDIYAVANNPLNELHLYKVITHGTYIFKHYPQLQNQITAWYQDKL